ncbi:armadillo-type protein [Phycomyces blakesleeanus]
MSIDPVEDSLKFLLAIKDADTLLSQTQPIVKAFQHLGALLTKNASDITAWSNATQLAQVVADGARTESTRTPLGEAGVLEKVTDILRLAKEGQTDYQIQALRVYGNMCFDHNDNRQKVHDAGVIPLAIPFLEQGHRPDLVRTCCGFCLNSSMDFEPIQADIATYGGVKLLTELLDPARMDHGEEATVCMAAKVLDNLLGEDSVRKAFSSRESVSRLLEMINYEWNVDQLENLDLLENLADALLQVVLDDDDMQNAVVDSGFFTMLLDFLEKATLPLEAADDEDEKKRFTETQATISKIAVYATSTDEMLERLYADEKTLNRFFRMMNSESSIVSQTAVYALGNLARTDAHCVEMVEKNHLEKSLLKLLTSTENATFQYVILGCLKHLCLPKQNKAVIGNAGAIESVAPLLDTSKDMLKRNQFFAIGILKLLCANNYENSQRIITSPTTTEEKQTPLELVLAFIKRVDDSSAKSEATRILTNLVKSVWTQPITTSLALRTILVKPAIVEPIAELVRSSKFVVLKNDGIIALTVIFADTDSESSKILLKDALSFVIAPVPSLEDMLINQDNDDDDEKKPEEIETRTFLEVVVDTVCKENADIPSEVRCNACVFLEKVALAAQTVNDTKVSNVLYEKVLPQLKALTQGPETVVSFSKKAASAIAKSTIA